MIITVKSLFSILILSMASLTSFSDLESRAEVASSRIKIFGFLIRALAIAILYFWPPERLSMEEAPTKESIPSFNLLTNSSALAYLRASLIDSSVASL